MAQTIPQMFLEKVRQQPNMTAQLSKDGKGSFRPTSYAKLLENTEAFAAGLCALGVQRGDRIGLISDNRPEWLVTDLAILGLGASDVPRGSDATAQELTFILSWSECRMAVVENQVILEKLLEASPALPLLKTIIMIDSAGLDVAGKVAKAGFRFYSYPEIMQRGQAASRLNPELYKIEVSRGARDDLATIIYTSGTTGEPKGVMLSHGNFLHQTEYLPEAIGMKSGDILLSVLPVWHSFERVCQYVILQAGAAIAYSKPIGPVLLADMQAVQPQWFTSVPRIWESVQEGVYKSIRQAGGITQLMFGFFVAVGKSYAFFKNHILGLVPYFAPHSRVLEIAGSIIPFALLWPLRQLGDLLVYRKIKEKLGRHFVAGVSGGGALPTDVDRFFNAIGVAIIEGYGLTETAPVLGIRLPSHPVLGTVGPIIRGTEIRIVDEAGNDIGQCRKGIIQVRGPQVMMGYYKRPDLTAKAVSPDGWLNTGDLGMLTVNGEIKIVGRAKDTIVLRGGENVEPVPIEQKLCESRYIEQAVVVGQDERYLAALIVPKRENLELWARENNLSFGDYEVLVNQPQTRSLISSEISSLVCLKTGFKSFERISKFEILPESFQPGRELSAKQELKRHMIGQLYGSEIKELFTIDA
ncbi:MAG: AMP-binding protein [Spirochaetaceae bacterium]|nr:AMP-binding protein [Spirochaetaceae bacterium]